MLNIRVNLQLVTNDIELYVYFNLFPIVGNNYNLDLVKKPLLTPLKCILPRKYTSTLHRVIFTLLIKDIC